MRSRRRNCVPRPPGARRAAPVDAPMTAGARRASFRRITPLRCALDASHRPNLALKRNPEAAVDPNSKRQSVLARLTAIAIACLLFLQMAVAGAAALAAESGSGAANGAICLTQGGAGAVDRTNPSHDGHRHGLCCILHGVALGAPQANRFSSVALLPPPTGDFVRSAVDDAPMRRAEPKGDPQSPRPPPADVSALS